MRRFERICDDVEQVEEYRPGGYHPVNLGDVFNDKYKVVAKLAYGTSSTVWLAQQQPYGRRQSKPQNVALKILKADVSKDSNELRIFSHIKDFRPNHRGRNHVLQLLDCFEHRGPNGTHLCLVMPFMISDGQLMTTDHKPRSSEFVREFSRQVLLGLDFLHESGVIHCDLQPANILVSDSRHETERNLQEPDRSKVRWLDNITRDHSAPPYLFVSQRPWNLLSDINCSDLLLKIGDIGGSTLSPRNSYPPVTPVALRAPELIAGAKWDRGIDVWMLGCLIFELAANRPLFPLGTFGCTREQVQEEHRDMINELLGQGYTSDRLDITLKECLPKGFSSNDRATLLNFLHLTLEIDAQKRQTTKELLKHPWITGGYSV